MTISSEYTGELIEATNRRGNVKFKPNQIVEYNKFMSGVDRQDQMIAYPCECRILRWYKKNWHSFFKNMYAKFILALYKKY